MLRPKGDDGSGVMYGRATSYTGGDRARNALPLLRLLAFGLFVAALGACTSLGERGSGRLAARAPAKPFAAKVSVIDEVDPSDWEAIRREIAASSEATTQSLAWRNPDTGSNGSIALLPAITKAGALCRSFAATVNDVRGIHRYGGDACLRTDGRWQLHGVTADDVVAT
jgi:hypothetical protein